MCNFDAQNDKTTMSTMQNNTSEKKMSLWERAHQMGPVIKLAPGFSFDSDSKIKLYEYNGKVIA